MSKTIDTPTTTEQVADQTLLQSFHSLGMFAPKDVQPDTIELPDGSKAQFYVRALSDTSFRSLWSSKDRAKLIAATICDEDGKPVLSPKQAGELKPKIAAILEEVVLKHAGFGSDAQAEQEEAGND